MHGAGYVGSSDDGWRPEMTCTDADKNGCTMAKDVYQVRVLPDSPRGAVFTRLYTFAADRAGRVRMAQHLRRDHPLRRAAPRASPSDAHSAFL